MTLSPSSDWLALAAAPTFAGMALLTGIGSAPDMLCAGEASALGGMELMYLLMSAFHLAPWLRLIGRQGTNRQLSGSEGR
jgi:hypothetical protein